MTIELRPYQTEAADAVFDAWMSGVHAPAVVLPTGAGKSVVMGEVVRRVYHSRREGKIVVLAHRSELLKQLKRAVNQLDPDIVVGTVKAQEREYHCDVIVASVQTLAASPEHIAQMGEIGAVLVDECHHYAAVTYRSVLEQLGTYEYQGWTPTVGFTATMWRSDKGLETVWDDVVYSKDLRWVIDQGFLIKPRGLVVVTDQIDLSNVRIEAGDYVQSELEEAMMASVESTVTAMETHCRERACIVFAAGVGHAKALAESLTEAGMPSQVIVGSMNDDERQDVYSRFNSGELHSMVTVTVLTEGADFPRCDCVVMARPTASKSLHSQQVGRAIRLYTNPETGEEKTDALVLDLAGHTRKMALMDLSKLDDSFSVDFVSPDGDVVDPPEVEESKGTPPRQQRHGVLQVEEVDLFDPKNNVHTPRWLQTRQGTLFLPGMERLVFLRQGESGSWFVGWATPKGELKGAFIEQHSTRDDAMAGAVRYARKMNDLPLRTKNQFKNVAPTEAQVRLGRILGIVQPESMTKARLADEISSAIAFRRLDCAIA